MHFNLDLADRVTSSPFLSFFLLLSLLALFDFRAYTSDFVQYSCPAIIVPEVAFPAADITLPRWRRFPRRPQIIGIAVSEWARRD